MNPSGITGIIIPRGLEIVGELLASEDLTIQGNFGGTLDGTILATERIDLMPTAIVRAHLTTAKIMLADGAKFQGTIDPERTEAATHVARFREKQSPER